MRSLKDVIGALRRELDEALEDQGRMPGRTRLTAERITLTLELAVREDSGSSAEGGLSFGVLTAGVSAAGSVEQRHGRTHTHTLTLEFKPQVAGPVPPPDPRPFGERVREAAPGSPVDLQGASPAPPAELLALVFGPPGGFDSHCRAEIFLTAVGELSDEEYAQLPAALAGGRTGPPGDRLAHACAQVANILRTGPAKSVEKGAGWLQSVLPAVDRNALRNLITATWRNEPVPEAGTDEDLPAGRPEARPERGGAVGPDSMGGAG